MGHRFPLRPFPRPPLCLPSGRIFFVVLALGFAATGLFLAGRRHFADHQSAAASSWIQENARDAARYSSPLEGQRPDPIDFTAEELRELNRRFGVHGPQPAIAQLFTEGLDQLQPLRNHTLSRVEELRPLILRHSMRQRINPMLVAAVLFDEMQHAKPGEDSALAVRSGLFQTQGPAQLSVGEMVKQGLLPDNATPEQILDARLQLLDPDHNVELLVGKFARLANKLGFPRDRLLMASGHPRDAKALATLAYLHNGKLDYPARILRYMQDPALHAAIYSKRQTVTSPLI
ncbi:MAG: hypothetical protein RLZZ117_2226 [Cyanobacteriota bacterium]|jgi:hypothetical protein